MLGGAKMILQHRHPALIEAAWRAVTAGIFDHHFNGVFDVALPLVVGP